LASYSQVFIISEVSVPAFLLEWLYVVYRVHFTLAPPDTVGEGELQDRPHPVRHRGGLAVVIEKLSDVCGPYLIRLKFLKGFLDTLGHILILDEAVWFEVGIFEGSIE